MTKTQSLYQEYAQLVQQEKEIKLLKEKMLGAILKDMMDRQVSSEDHEYGKFTVTILKKWQYPEEVIKLEDKAKAAKAKAQSNETATYTEEPSLRFTLSKELF
jgi:hypothetical protein